MKWILLIKVVVLSLLLSCNINPYQQGAILYNNFCASCHGEDGAGLRGLVPPLAQADYLIYNQDRLACIIRYGLKDSIIVNGRLYDQPMEGIPNLNDVEITNIINYINHSWGNDLEVVKHADIKSSLERCEGYANPIK